VVCRNLRREKKGLFMLSFHSWEQGVGNCALRRQSETDGDTRSMYEIVGLFLLVPLRVCVKKACEFRISAPWMSAEVYTARG
jgi:hypothetical protein